MNPTLDKDRAQFVATRVANAPKQLFPEWLRPEKELPVISVPTDWVMFSIINHRTKAEQMRVVRQLGKEDVFQDPFSKEAQEEQYKILIEQAEADGLFEDLSSRGQLEPAVITADGVLINGNRRGAALRKLLVEDDMRDAKYIRAFVLPDDVTAEEILDLETELQVSNDYRQDYTWVNEAFLIEDIFKASGKDWEKVAKRVRLKPNEALEKYKQLQQLHQLIEMSADALSYADFVDKQTPFTELSTHVKNKSPEESKVVRDAFFLGVVSDTNYRKLRHLRRPDANTFIEDEFSKDPMLSKFVEMVREDAAESADENDDLLDGILGETQPNSNGDVSSVLSFLAAKDKSEDVTLPDGQVIPSEDILNSVKNAVTNAADEAEEESKDSKAVTAPIVRMDSAIGDAKRVLAILPKARSYGEFDEEAFRDRIVQLKEVVARLEQQ